MTQSNREKHEAEQRAKLAKTKTGDLIAEMIALGDPNSVMTKHRKHEVVRFNMLKEELNKRLSGETVEA